MPANNRQISGYTIVKRALSVIGLPVPTSVAGSTDQMMVQIWQLLTELGQELLNEHQWQFKTKVFPVATVPGTKLYDLPADFVRFVDDTGWNNTARLPLVGPMTDQQWALLVARQLGGTTFQLQYRINNNQLELYYSPSTSNNLALTYISRGWVQDASAPTVFKDQMEADGDICLYDPRLIISMLRFRFRRAKGFNTTDLEQEYNDALSNAKNNDSPGQVLSLSFSGQDDGYLGYKNMPDTNYGI